MTRTRIGLRPLGSHRSSKLTMKILTNLQLKKYPRKNWVCFIFMSFLSYSSYWCYRTYEKNLALSHLWVFQKRCKDSHRGWPDLPFLQVRCHTLQSQGWWSLTISGLSRSCCHLKSESPHNQVFRT